MASIKLELIKRKPKKDGTYPVCFKLIHNRRVAEIRTKINILEKDWNANEARIKYACKKFDREGVRKLNSDLHASLARFEEMLVDLERNNPALNRKTAAEVKNILINKTRVNSFSDYINDKLRQLNEKDKISTRHVLKNAKNFFIRVNKGDFRMDEITPELLKKAEKIYMETHDTLNGFFIYINLLHSVINQAIKEGVIGPEHSPFASKYNQFNISSNLYQIKRSNKIKKRLIAIKYSDIAKLEQYKPPTPAQQLYLDVFLFSFYAWGINLTDIAYLTDKNIVENKLYYRRRKTRRDYVVPLTQKAIEIIARWRGKSRFDFMFPVLRKNPLDARKCYSDIQLFNINVNNNLDKIRVQVGIARRITMYSARHSFATIAKKEKGIPVEYIKEALGHSDVSITEAYLEQFENDELFNRFKGVVGD